MSDRDCWICGGTGTHPMIDGLKCPFCSGPERRSSERHQRPLKGMALVRSSQLAGLFPFRVIDVSMSGIRLELAGIHPEVLAEIGRFDIRLDPPFGGSPLSLACELRRVNDDGSVAAEFISPDQAGQVMLWAGML